MDDFENILNEVRQNQWEKKAKSYQLVRTVTPQECSWLHRTFEIGETVYRYSGYTSKLIGKNGSAFCKEIDKLPFFELPNDAAAIVI